jgi:Ni/Fe-hydrogenase subunit HybB-like protein
VAQAIQRDAVQVRRPEKETRPGVFYAGAHQATLDPLAARRPEGGLFAWASQGPGGAQAVVSGHPGRPASSAAALLSYDVPHQVPWGWRVSLYTWTKSIAAGGFAVAAALALAGRLGWDNAAVRWAAPVLALAFLAVTGALLIADLKHPGRFYLIFTRRHWRSWLVRGSFVLGGYGGVVALYLLAALAGWTGARQVLAGIALPLALATACYTAYLFAQAKGRDLWQSPLLAPHLAIQAALAGAGAMLPLLIWLAPGSAVTACEAVLAVAAGLHVIFAAGEVITPHVTAHAHLAVSEMTRGRYARLFWPALAAVAAGVAAPWIGVAATPLVLAGLLGHEHAYVQAGQSVPLA